MKRKILIVIIAFVITRNLTHAKNNLCNHIDERNCDAKYDDGTEPIAMNSGNDSTTSKFPNQSTAISEFSVVSTEANSKTFSPKEYSTTIDFIKNNEETSSPVTEIPFPEDVTTFLTTDFTTQETTTQELELEECKLNDTSYAITDSNNLIVNWDFNDSPSCDTSTINITLTLINQSCLDKCDDEICLLCTEETNDVNDRLNFTFSKKLIPCIIYSYKIQIVDSSDVKTVAISTILKYQKPKEPQFINSTDTTLTLKVILNDPVEECQDIIYAVECKSPENESINTSSITDVVFVENLEPRQNYSCSAKVKHGTSDWSEYSEVSICTTKAPDCNLRNNTYAVDNQTNILTIYWETNGSEMCDAALVSIKLSNKNCIEKFEEDRSCNRSIEIKANDLTHSFSESLIPCAKYMYQIQIINSTTPSSFERTFDAHRKYAEIKNLKISDEVEIETNSKTLNMALTWEYENVECLETFTVSARGQGNNYESSIQGYKHTFMKLEACEEFNITIYIKDNQNISTSAMHSMKRINPSEIRNLSLSQEDDKTSIKIAWMAPEYGAKCIDRYIIRIKNDSEEEFIRNTTSNVYLLSDVYACVNYTIIISISTTEIDNGNLETTISSTVSTTTFSPSISPAIEYINESSINGSIKTEPRQFVQTQILQLKKQTDKSLSFLVVPSNDPKNKCPIVKYYVECTSTETGNKTESASNTSNIVEVDKLEPFHNYSCKASIENENQIKSIWSYSSVFMTNEGVPNAPFVETAQGTVNSTSFTIKWKEPTSPKGIITQYHVYIRFVKFEYDRPSYCTEEVTGEDKTLSVKDLDSLSYTFKNAKPSSTYSFQVRASNQASDGDFSTSEKETTKAGPPDMLQNFTVKNNIINLNEKYDKTIHVDFNCPCKANGKLKEFVIEFKSSLNVFNKTIFYNKTDKENGYKYTINTNELEPDINYTITGYAINEEGTKGKDFIYRDFKLNPGIPELNENIKITSDSTTTSVYVLISDNIFDSKVGKITHAKIFILQWNCSDMSYKQGFNHDDDQNIFWEEAMNEDCIPEYDTGIKIPNGKEKQLVEGIGTETYCESNSICNGKLKPGTTYGLTFRLYTETGYANTPYFKIHTNKEVPIVAISIIILSILCLVFLIGFYISCRRTQELRKSALDSPYDRKDISVQNFLSYHILMSKSDNEKIKEEFKAIQYFSDTLDRTYIASRANEKLNRYTNIYPYDSTRVVLNDDEFENDYINASYINGYYYPKEYIAAQGPKPDTVLDFWRMILQHRTESIVMLTSLVENNKVKCHEYFPRLNGHLKCGNIDITCVKEQNFPFYIKRLLIVVKDGMKLSVNHYYFCKWPDYGCPSNALDLIEFVKIVRNERQKPIETFVVHCSAGVGRTGTFIAVDIMMQRIKKEAKINIFDLVKQLRSQRMKMVQSCDQYVFLYTAALELINMTRRVNVFQNLRDTAFKFINELEIPERWKRHDNIPNELPNIAKKDEKETIM